MKRDYNFIERAKVKHNGFYSYEESLVYDSQTRANITYPLYGDFIQLTANHLAGENCYNCSLEKRRYNTVTYKEKAREVHSGLYTYDKLDYVDKKIKVTKTCKIHGDFDQLPGGHINNKQGYPVCGLERKSKGEATISKCLNDNNISY